MAKLLFNLTMILLLTIISQLGGIAWLIGMRFRRRFVAFAAAYALLCLSALLVAPLFGRVPISCASDGPLRMQSWLYCGLNRQYVVPELKDVLEDLAQAMAKEYPETVTLVLDANFPFLDGFPLLPHLSHDDGRKADIAFYYRDGHGYQPGITRSPIGYFAFEDGPEHCPDDWPTLRWDLAFLQGAWPDLEPEPDRMRRALSRLGSDPRVARMFLEPHLRERFGTTNSKLRFQGCRAARHDDHLHIQL